MEYLTRAKRTEPIKSALIDMNNAVKGLIEVEEKIGNKKLFKSFYRKNAIARYMHTVEAIASRVNPTSLLGYPELMDIAMMYKYMKSIIPKIEYRGNGLSYPRIGIQNFTVDGKDEAVFHTYRLDENKTYKLYIKLPGSVINYRNMTMIYTVRDLQTLRVKEFRNDNFLDVAHGIVHSNNKDITLELDLFINRLSKFIRYIGDIFLELFYDDSIDINYDMKLSEYGIYPIYKERE